MLQYHVAVELAHLLKDNANVSKWSAVERNMFVFISSEIVNAMDSAECYAKKVE